MKANRFHVACGLLACALAPGAAAARNRPERFSITLPAPYSRVIDVVREVCSDGVIHGTEQYQSETGIPGADAVDSSSAFGPWKGPGEALYKARRKAIAPSHFEDSRDIGTVTLRYIVEAAGPDQTRLTIDAVFVEDSRHGRHLSQGMVEVAEFGEIAKKLKQIDRGETAAQTKANLRTKN